MEIRVVVAGAILCLLGLIIFEYGINNMNFSSAVSSSFIVVVGIFVGIAGMLMILMNLLHLQHTS